MWHSGPWSAWQGGDQSKVGLNDLRGPSQPEWFCDSWKDEMRGTCLCQGTCHRRTSEVCAVHKDHPTLLTRMSPRKGTSTKRWASKLLEEELAEPLCPSTPQAHGLCSHSCLSHIHRKRSNQMSNKAWEQFFFLTQTVQTIADTG